MSTKKTYEEVKQKIESIGYTLLAERYESNSAKMDCVCSVGHQIKIDWASFASGHLCNTCSQAANGVSKKQVNGIKAKEAFEAEGYQLLDKYEGSKKRLRFLCPKGHKYSMTWDSFKGGKRCAICAGGIVTRKDVKEAFKAVGYTLLGKYNRDHRERLDFICNQGHQHKIAWSDFQSGKRCVFCSKRAPIDPEFVEQFFLKAGYTPLTRYQRKNDKISYVCPEGHQDSMIWYSFSQGKRCPRCRGKILTHEEVELAFAAEGYQLLDRYKNSTTHLKYICPQGHQHSIIWAAFQQGHRCAYCAGQVVTHEEVESAFAAEGYKLLDQYKNSAIRLRYICPEGHSHSMNWGAFKGGSRCAYCAGKKPTEDQREINSIKKGVAGLISIYLRNQKVQKTFSATGFAGGIAKQIHCILGARPDGYHLDHIIPQSFFDFRDQDEIAACWHIDNLRYIPALENIVKGRKLTIEDVKNFSDSQLKLLAKASRRPRTFDSFLVGLIDKEPVKQPITPTQLSLFL